MSYLAAAHVSMSGTVGMGDLIRVSQIGESQEVMHKLFSSRELMNFLKGFKTLMADGSVGDGEENVP